MLIFLCGVIAGISIAMIIFRIYIVATLRIDRSDPEDGPYMFLELSKDVDKISTKKYVILKVKLKDSFSRE